MAIQCSRCDTKVLRPQQLCTVWNGKPCNACTEDMELEKKIQKLEMEIEKIHTRRRALRTTMNKNHDRLIPTFPPEIISHIFLQYSPPNELFNDDSNNPLSLGAVCHKWCELAWATPNLWTSLRIAPNENYESNLDDLPQLVKEWLERSASLPLTIKLEDGWNWLDRCLRRNEHLVKTLNEHSARWRDIDFEIAAQHLHLFSGSSQGNILHRLILSHLCWGNVSTFSMKSKPSLTELILRKIGLPHVNIVWDNLAVASVDNIGVDECFKLIRRAPHLETLKLRAINPSSNIFPIPNTRIVHPHLHLLEVSGIKAKTVVAGLLNSLSLPSLEEWQWAYNIYFPPDKMISFVKCFSSRLKTLKTCIDLLDHDQVITFLSHLSSLVFLDLHVATPTEVFFSLLCASTQSPLFLPHLQSLEFFCEFSFPWKSLLQIFAVPRWKTLRVKVNVHLSWFDDDETTKLLMELVEEGINLSIMNNYQIDLLQEYKETMAARAASNNLNFSW